MTPQCLAILNITPDSFSDGGRYFAAQSIRAQLQTLIASPLPLTIDIGFESTAPMNSAISADEEIRRFQDLLLPALTTIQLPAQLQLSIDTYKSETFEQIYQTLRRHHILVPLIWNDVSGKLDASVISFLQKHPDCRYIFCHNLAPSRDATGRHMDAVKGHLSGVALREDLIHYFQEAYRVAMQASIQQQLIFDPCFGFSKTRAQNQELLSELMAIISPFPPDLPWVIGLSRKSFLRRLTPETKRPLNTPAEFERSELLQILLLEKFWRELPDRPLLYRLHNIEHFATLLDYQRLLTPSLLASEKEL